MEFGYCGRQDVQAALIRQLDVGGLTWLVWESRKATPPREQPASRVDRDLVADYLDRQRRTRAILVVVRVPWRDAAGRPAKSYEGVRATALRQALVEVRMRDPGNYFEQALLHRAMGDRQNARLAGEKALAAASKAVPLLVDVAFARLEAGDPAGAAALAREAARLSPRDALALVAPGTAQAVLSATGSAEPAALALARQVNPGLRVTLRRIPASGTRPPSLEVTAKL